MKNLDDTGYALLVDRIYDAAVEPDRWQAVVDEVSRVLQVKALLLLYDGTRDALPYYSMAGVDPILVIKFGSQYCARNPYLKPAMRLPVDVVSWSHRLAAPDVVRGTEFYQDFLKPAGVSLEHVVVKLVQHPSMLAVLALSGEPDDVERDQHPLADAMNRLKLPLARALQINTRLGSGRLAAASFERTLEAMPAAAFVLDQQYRLMLTNSAADELMRADKVLSTNKSGELKASMPADEARLSAYLRGAYESTRQPLPIFSATRPRAYLCQLVPLASTGASQPDDRKAWTELLAPTATTMLLVTPRDRLPQISAETIASAYQLTAAEARLVAALAGGTAIVDYALATGIAESTARNQLASVAGKTGFSRQAELVANVASTLGRLSHPK